MSPTIPAVNKKGNAIIKIQSQSSIPLDKVKMKKSSTLKNGKTNCFHFESIISFLAINIGIIAMTIGKIQMNDML